jgi:lipopolysaccharide transport system ATP-binding protein
MTQSDVCVEVHGVSKKFSRSLKRSFIYGARDIGGLILGKASEDMLRPSEFWAVRDVSLQLRRGQSIGIVGLNGSGKTTLLRMISGILRPTLGKINVEGRIAPMLALGAGFKPVLSGRENIFLNLALLGVSERAIRNRYDSIVDFAELQESIEAPIGTYSSGMIARLGFACAVHTDPKIMVVDEVLSVGDTRFRMKCRNRINELRRSGTSMLLVSHSAPLIETLSDECLFMSKGRAIAQGSPREVLKAYTDSSIASAMAINAGLALTTTASIQSSEASDSPKGDGPARSQSADGRALAVLSILVGAEGRTDSGYWSSGLAGELGIELQCNAAIDEVSVNLMITDLTHQPGEMVQWLKSSKDNGWMRMQTGRVTVRLGLPHVGLRPGIYRLKISITCGEKHDLLDVFDGFRLVVRDAGRTNSCLFYQPRGWDCEGGEFSGQPDRVQDPMEVDFADD